LLLKRIGLTVKNIIELHAFLGLIVDVLCVAFDAFEFFVLLDFGVSWRLIQISQRELIRGSAPSLEIIANFCVTGFELILHPSQIHYAVTQT
jgi:hypothetical protein